MKTKLFCVVLFCFLMFSVTPAVHAQGGVVGIGMSAVEKAAKITEWMKKNLGLTPSQIPLVKNLNEKYVKMAEKLLGSGKSQSEMASALKTQSQQKDGELKGILNASQFATWLAKKGEVENIMKSKLKI